jgi:trans-aconitate 2-methyltransferase
MPGSVRRFHVSWSPQQYLKFAGPRLRPALDLLGRIDVSAPVRVYDLGCGTGNVTALLAERWPEAQIVGVDSSQEMLARAPVSNIVWERADLASWRPAQPPDLLFSNAALHWLDGHATLFPRLLSELAPGGVLAVQMPHNHGAPSHTAMVEAANAGPWAHIVVPALRAQPVEPPAFYYELLAGQAQSLELWETEYLHVLEVLDRDNHPVVEWTRGTALQPLLQAAGPYAAGLLAAYTERIRAAYPEASDGRILFPFRRLFLVAKR